LDLLLNRRTTVGFFPWRFVEGESSIGRCVAFVEDREYDELLNLKESMSVTRFGDAFSPAHVDRIEALSSKH
jgi:arylformamidase